MWDRSTLVGLQKKANNLKPTYQEMHPCQSGRQPQLVFLSTSGEVGGTARISLNRVKRFWLSKGGLPGSLLITQDSKVSCFSCQHIQGLVQSQSKYSNLMVEKRHQGAEKAARSHLVLPGDTGHPHSEQLPHAWNLLGQSRAAQT